MSSKTEIQNYNGYFVEAFCLSPNAERIIRESTVASSFLRSFENQCSTGPINRLDSLEMELKREYVSSIALVGVGIAIGAAISRRAGARKAADSSSQRPPSPPESTPPSDAPGTPRRGIRSEVVHSPLPPGALPRHSSFEGISVVKEVDDILNPINPVLVSPQLINPTTARPLVVGVAGGTGSGKTTLARAIRESLTGVKISYLSHDSYYRDLRHLSFEERSQHNFDHPDALDTERMVADLSALKRGETAHIPTYDFATHSRTLVTETVEPQRVILVEVEDTR